MLSFKGGCFNGNFNGMRGFVSQKLPTQGCSRRNDCHQFFPVKKNSSRISTFSILLHCSDKRKYVSLLLYPCLPMAKRLCLKYENINSFQKDGKVAGESIRMQLPWCPVSSSLYTWNSAQVTSEGSEWPYTGLPPRFLPFTVQITQRICVM